MSIDELIEALERATGPSNVLNARIHMLVGERDQSYYNFRGIQPKGQPDEKSWRIYCKCRAPKYTASIDDALTLVPDGRLWSLGAIANVSGFVAILDNDGRSHRGAAPAIALCIAALKARKALADA